LIIREIGHYDQVQFSKTESRSVLGCMNDFAFNFQVMVEEAGGLNRLDLSEAEATLSHMPCGMIHYQSPEDVVKELMGVH